MTISKSSCDLFITRIPLYFALIGRQMFLGDRAEPVSDSTFPMCFREFMSEKPQNCNKKLFIRHSSLDPLESSNRAEKFFGTVNLHILEIRKFGEDSAEASMFYEGPKSR